MENAGLSRGVVFYLVDGARPDILTKLMDQGTLPNIKKYLSDEGSMTKGVTCLPSTTGPAYLPFLTGSYPGVHDITGIRWFDKEAYFSSGRWSRDSMRSYCGYEAKYFNDDMNPNLPSLFEEYDHSFNIYNMITKGVSEDRDLTKKGKTGLYFKAHFYHQHHQVDEAGHVHLLACLDANPDFVFAVFPSVDWDAHTYRFDSEQTIEAYKIADRSLGEVVQKLKALGRYDETLIIMASDHGLSSTHAHLDLGKFFKSHNYRVLEYPSIWTLRPQVAVFISGNSFASLSFLDQQTTYYSKELMSNHGKVLAALVDEAAIDFIIYRKDQGSYIIRSGEGTAALTVDRDKCSYHPIEADPLMLGDFEEDMDEAKLLAATFDKQYPDAIVQIHQLMQSKKAGDVLVCAAIGYDLRDFWEIPEHKGSHGSLHWEHMHVPILTNKKNHIPEPVRTTHIHQVIKDWLAST
jgi:Uncharacterized proteins of the AP superfamily